MQGLRIANAPMICPGDIFNQCGVHRIQKGDTTVSGPFRNKSFAIDKAI